MRRTTSWFASGICCIAAVISARGAAAGTHVIVGTQQRTWTYAGQTSSISPPKPLIVDDLGAGDIIEIQVPGSIPHGFIPIKTENGQRPTETKDPVLMCGESASAKPNAVLQELDCGPISKVGARLNNGATLRMQVLSTFKGEVDFWCVVHLNQMLGVLKIKQ